MIINKFDIEIKEGATFDLTLTWHTAGVDSPLVDLTGYSAEMVIKTAKGDVEDILTLSSGGDDPMIILGGEDGTVQILIPAAATKGLPFVADAEGCLKGVYDLELTLGLTVTRLAEGVVLYNLEV